MVIYKAENKINGQVYIGKTVNTLNKRRSDHLRCKGNNFFHRAIRKYGSENFEWSILTETDSESKLNALEKFYIMLYRKMGSVYNLTDGGEGTTGRMCTEETKAKMKARVYTDEQKAKMSESRKGKKLSPESYKKSAISRTGLKRAPLSDEVKTKISNTLKGKTKGTKFTEEHKRKIAESRIGIEPWNKGINISEETKKKISDTKRGVKRKPYKQRVA